MFDSTINRRAMYGMIPGLERFDAILEDENNISVNINTADDGDVGDTPAADVSTDPADIGAETSDAVDSAANTVEAASEAETTVDQAEMVFNQLDEIRNWARVARERGVDSTFLALVNYRNNLSDNLGIRLPSCESFDEVADPWSPTSRAVVAGLEGIGGKIVDFIKSVCKKIMDLVSRIIEWFRRTFSSTDKNAMRLLKALKELKSAPAKGSMAKLPQYHNIYTSLQSCQLGIKNADNLSSLPVNSLDEKAIKSTEFTVSEIDVSATDKTQIERLLTEILRLCTQGKLAEKSFERAREQAKKNLSEAESGNKSENEIKKLQEEVKKNNVLVKYLAKMIKAAMKTANMGIKFASVWINRASRNDSGSSSSSDSKAAEKPAAAATETKTETKTEEKKMYARRYNGHHSWW